MFIQRKIAAFQDRISDLPDTPTLTATELKARFDACPEELRQALNGVCDDGKILEDRLDAYRAQTFTGEITREMLAPTIREELDSKTNNAENIAAHESLDNRLTANETQIAQLTTQKCEIYFGTYTPSDGMDTDYIHLGFQPRAVLLMSQQPTAGYAVPPLLAGPEMPHQILSIIDSGFSVAYDRYRSTSDSVPYRYIAFK